MKNIWLCSRARKNSPYVVLFENSGGEIPGSRRVYHPQICWEFLSTVTADGIHVKSDARGLLRIMPFPSPLTINVGDQLKLNITYPVAHLEANGVKDSVINLPPGKTWKDEVIISVMYGFWPDSYLRRCYTLYGVDELFVYEDWMDSKVWETGQSPGLFHMVYFEITENEVTIFHCGNQHLSDEVRKRLEAGP